jgi:hypothetical protein
LEWGLQTPSLENEAIFDNTVRFWVARVTSCVMRPRKLLHCAQETGCIPGLVSPVDGLWIDHEKRVFRAENQLLEIVD